MLFWDDFSDDGLLSAEPDPHNGVGVVSVQRTIPSGGSANFSFVLAWRFPNRTPEWCGWKAQKVKRKPLLEITTVPAFPPRWRLPNTSPPTSRASKARPACSPGHCAKARSPAGSRRRQRRQSLDACQHHLFPDRRWRIPRLRGRERPYRLLLRELHARLELRKRHSSSFPISCPVLARRGFRLLPGIADSAAIVERIPRASFSVGMMMLVIGRSISRTPARQRSSGRSTSNQRGPRSHVRPLRSTAATVSE